MLADDRSLAAQVQANLGVTTEAVEAQLAELDMAASSDELPEEAGARRLQLRVEGAQVTVVLEEPGLARALADALVGQSGEQGHKGPAGTPSSLIHTIAHDDPAAMGFPELWLAVRRGIDDVLARLGRPTDEAAPLVSGWELGVVRRHLSFKEGPTVLRRRSAESEPEEPTAEPPHPPDED